MTDETSRNVAARVLMNVVAFAAFWLVGFGLIQFAERVLHGWPSSEMMQLVTCAIGILIAFRLRAGFVALVLAGQLAFTAAELLMHAIYGIRAVQGAPTHFAVMIAGTLGALLGVFLAPYVRRGGPERSVVNVKFDDAAPPADDPSPAVLTA